MKRLIMVGFLLTLGACASVDKPVDRQQSVQSSPTTAVTFDPQTGVISLHENGRIVTLGTVLKNGSLETGQSSTPVDYALALLIIVKSRYVDEWAKIAEGLPR